MITYLPRERYKDHNLNLKHTLAYIIFIHLFDLIWFAFFFIYFLLPSLSMSRLKSRGTYYKFNSIQRWKNWCYMSFIVQLKFICQRQTVGCRVCHIHTYIVDHRPSVIFRSGATLFVLFIIIMCTTYHPLISLPVS